MTKTPVSLFLKLSTNFEIANLPTKYKNTFYNVLSIA